ncbi:hypothetical protein BJ912DRAFT_1104995, partial [Pholiota molesta]
GIRWDSTVRQGLGNLYGFRADFRRHRLLYRSTGGLPKISDLLGQANVARILSDLHFSHGNLVKPRNMPLKVKDSKTSKLCAWEGNALRTLGNIYLALDRVPEARQALEQSLIYQAAEYPLTSSIPSIPCGGYIRSDQLSAAEALLTHPPRWILDVEQIAFILTSLDGCRVLGHLATVYFKTNRLDEAEQVLKSIPDLGIWIDSKYTDSGPRRPLHHQRRARKCGSFIGYSNGCMQGGGERSTSYQQGNILRSMGTLHVKRSRAICHRQFKEAREFHRKAQWVSEQATDLKRLGEAYEMLEMAEEAGAHSGRRRSLWRAFYIEIDLLDCWSNSNAKRLDGVFSTYIELGTSKYTQMGDYCHISFYIKHDEQGYTPLLTSLIYATQGTQTDVLGLRKTIQCWIENGNNVMNIAGEVGEPTLPQVQRRLRVANRQKDDSFLDTRMSLDGRDLVHKALTTLVYA